MIITYFKFELDVLQLEKYEPWHTSNMTIVYFKYQKMDEIRTKDILVISIWWVMKKKKESVGQQ